MDVAVHTLARISTLPCFSISNKYVQSLLKLKAFFFFNFLHFLNK